MVATFDLGSTVEFKRWLLGFGHCYCVLSPNDFRKEVRKELSQAAGFYNKREPLSAVTNGHRD